MVLTDSPSREMRYVATYTRFRRWEQRTEGQQKQIQLALRAFRNWRVERGEAKLEHFDPWQMPLPDRDTLKLYLMKVAVFAPVWREHSKSALRLYFYHQDCPSLFEMVGTIQLIPLVGTIQPPAK